jgi:hypothetical protein
MKNVSEYISYSINQKWANVNKKYDRPGYYLSRRGKKTLLIEPYVYFICEDNLLKIRNNLPIKLIEDELNNEKKS